MSNSSLAERWSSSAPYLLSVLRIMAASLFVLYGTTKLFAFPAAVMPGGGTAPLTSLAGFAGALEFVGGAFLLVGLLTRPVAFLLSGQMAVAYFTGHAPSGVLAGSQWRRPCRLLLLPLALFFRGRAGSMEHRCAATP